MTLHVLDSDHISLILRACFYIFDYAAHFARPRDSDHISLILRGHPQVINHLQSLDPAQWAVTVISIQEIFNVCLNDPRYQDRQVELCTRL